MWRYLRYLGTASALCCFIMLVIHDEHMAYADVGGEILITKLRGVRPVEDVSIIYVTVEKQGNLFSTTLFDEHEVDKERKLCGFSWMENCYGSVNGKWHSGVPIGEFEPIWQRTFVSFDPICINPAGELVSRGHATVLYFNRDVVRVGFFEFWMRDGNIGAQLATGGNHSVVSQVASGDPQQNCRERENEGEDRKQVLSIVMNEAPEARLNPTEADAEHGGLIIRGMIAGICIVLLVTYARPKR